MSFQNKYLKYKTKYMLSKQTGEALILKDNSSNNTININKNNFIEFISYYRSEWVKVDKQSRKIQTSFDEKESMRVMSDLLQYINLTEDTGTKIIDNKLYNLFKKYMPYYEQFLEDPDFVNH